MLTFFDFEFLLTPSGSSVTLRTALSIACYLSSSELLLEIFLFDGVVQLVDLLQVDFGDLLDVFFILLRDIPRLGVALLVGCTVLPLLLVWLLLDSLTILSELLLGQTKLGLVFVINCVAGCRVAMVCDSGVRLYGCAVISCVASYAALLVLAS